MISALITTFLLGLLSLPALAQDAAPLALPGSADGKGVSPTQICGALVNQTEYRIYGTIATDVAGQKDGFDVRHNDTLRLEKGERIEFCSTGPFYEGQRLALTLKTLFPVFECKTKIDQGDIVITAKPKETGYDWVATCY